MKSTFRSVFEEDFAEIITYLASEVSPELSSHFENRSAAAFEIILRQPENGRRRKDVSPAGSRSFRVNGFASHLIFYQVKADEALFIRVRHGAMDLPARFPEA